MSGIYIHVPFCKKACHYCDFHFSISLLKSKQSLIEAICHEIEVRNEYLIGTEVSTLYFGGGTPSLLSYGELQEILEEVHKHFNLVPKAEITLEANPDDLTPAKLRELKDLGINRLSVGIQSFFDEDLLLMNRSHNAEQATRSVKEAQQAGFENITIDLIYGLPNLSMDKWEQNLQKTFELGVPHLSAYNLTVERKTALDHMVREKKVSLPPESLVIEQFQKLIGETKKHGLIHYEISNFGKEGMFSWHNSSYWKNESYLGIGPSAHSYNGVSRQWNVANNSFYIKNVGSKQPWYEEELLTAEDKYNEHIMTRLRTIWGIDLEFVKKTFGADKLHSLIDLSKSYVLSGHILHEKETITLTQKGKLLADKIASDFFL
jgi:oxygen-independent coproporphyrinogen-3 oxidase